ncbi:uncharacterized protein L3040_006037 [Drepanopeziza brunnea f. sp. 'multigermtubi']|uniref:uncharacterized protein n=1 Tax=Drepanopeziza brunnea f. sp. 'multigermtubi' TaxID=698441 RepID=UPI002398EEA7|nr:hypothetical protein L3040_006037 [Drepanopeziza brunnea f. sp. 'multigermtubi']
MSCTEVSTFWRLCGHIVQGTRHALPCRADLEARQGFPCWNPMPNKKRPYFIVGYCPLCKEALTEAGIVYEDAHIVHDGGSNLRIINGSQNPRPPEEAGKIAVHARAEVEAWERAHTTRAQAAEEARALQALRDNRAMNWELMLTRLNSSNEPDETPYWGRFSNRWDDDITPLYAEAAGPFDENCGICDLNQDGMSRKLPCGHTYHLQCLETWFRTGNEQEGTCPGCRRLYRFLLHSDFGEPAYRWFGTERRFFQVAGYTDFMGVADRWPAQYKRGIRPDRWGEELNVLDPVEDPLPSRFHVPDPPENVFEME